MTPDPSDRSPSVWQFGPKHILFGILGLLTLFVVYNNERFIVEHADPLWTYYLPVRWLLLPHGMAGGIALALGATQFSTRIRQRYTRLHRSFGRCYVIAVVVAATISLSITLLRNERPLQIAIFTQASLWLLTTAVAFYCVRRRNFREHRQWMIRSYAITLIFLADRVIDAIPGLSDLDTDASPNVTWLCNIIAWVVPTFIISWPNIVRAPTDTTAFANAS